MVRKIIISAFIIFCLSILVGAYFFLQKRTIRAISPFSAISRDAAFVLYTGNPRSMLNKVLRDNIFWDDFSSTELFRPLHKNLSYLDSLVTGDEVFENWLSGNEACIAAYPSQRGQPGLVFFTQAKSSRQIRQISQKVTELAGQRAVVSSRSFRGVTITDVEFLPAEGKNNFSFAFYNGLFMYSNLPALVDETITTAGSENSLLDHDVFRNILATAGKNVDANFYINFDALSRLGKNSIREEKKPALTLLAGLSEWGELDLHLRNEGLLLNGFAHSSPSQTSFFDVLLNQEPVSLEIDQIIPSAASAFISLSMSNTSDYRADYLKYLSETGRLDQYSSTLRQIMEDYETDIESAFYEFMDGEMALVLFDTPAGGGERFMLFSTKSRSMAQNALSGIIRQAAEKRGVSPQALSKTYQVDRDISFEIYELPVNYLGEILFGELFSGTETNYFTFIDNYLVVGESFESLTFFLRENILNKTLSTDISYRRYSGNLSNKSNLNIHINISAARETILSFLTGDLGNKVKNDFPTLRNIQAFSLQVVSGRNMVYQNFFASYWPYQESKPQATWETVLDASPALKPYLVTNHNTGENEIFVQDFLNNIYLINRSGRILWKKKLPEPIMGEVFQIDFYRNRKLQFLFNTKNFLYLIDRNGEYVDRYPVKLTSPATSPLALFDYERNKDYRLFIACEDKKVYAFTKSGQSVSGWEFRGTENLVTSPLQHIRIGSRDYLVVADKFKTYILDRRGNPRVGVQKTFPISENNRLIFEPRTARNDPRLVTTDTLGNVWFIYFDGKVDSMSLGGVSSAHFFDFQDVNADGYRDFIFLDSASLQVTTSNREQLFSYNFVNHIDLPPAYYHFGARDRKVGITDRKDNQIYLFNGNGTIYRGLPLEGRTPFTIGYLKQPGGSFNLLVGYEGNLLLNYTVY